MAKSSKYKGTSFKRRSMIEMNGVTDLLKKIDHAGGKVDEAVKKAVDNSLEQVGMKMQIFMLGHRRTGETYKSLEQTSKVSGYNKVEGKVGYNINKGGLPAVFLDVGTPKQRPNFFIYYAVENSRQQIEEIQQATLNEILEGLK